MKALSIESLYFGGKVIRYARQVFVVEDGEVKETTYQVKRDKKWETVPGNLYQSEAKKIREQLISTIATAQPEEVSEEEAKERGGVLAEEGEEEE